MKRKIGFLTVVFAGLCLAASQGRDFTAHYAWRDAFELSDSVNVYLEITLRNGGPGVTDAQVVMRGQFDDREAENFLGPVSIGQGEKLTLKGSLKLSRSEFALWRQGRMPRFVIQTHDANGLVLEQAIQPVSGASQEAMQ